MSEFTHPRFQPGPAAGDLDMQAAEWVVARDGEAWTAEQARALNAWLEASGEHRAAYAHAEQTWAALGRLREAPELAAGLHRHETATPHVPSPSPSLVRRHRRGIAGAFAVLLAVVAVFGATDGDPWIALTADQRTATGEVRDVTLADGSRVRLGAASAIAVHFDANERRLELLKGEALFEAAPVRAGGESRPFVVGAAQGRTRALGTRFLVERLDRETRVIGIEHQVRVSLDGPHAGAAVLSPGQTVRYDAHGVGPVQPLDAGRATAWLAGTLVFDHMALGEVVQRLNRYHRTRIVVRGEALARREVSGVFPLDDTRGALRSIVDELGARSLHLPGLTVLY